MDLYGGAETVVVHLARYLEQKGFRSVILTLSSAPHEEYEGLDVVTPPEPIRYRLRSEKFSDVVEILKSACVLRSLVSRHIDNCDALNPHNFPAVWAIPPTRKRVVWLCNEIPDLWHSFRTSPVVAGLTKCGRLADKWIANRVVDEAVVSDRKNALRFSKRYGWWPDIIPYGISGSFFGEETTSKEGERIRARYGLDHDGFYVMHVGMISPSKKQLATIRAIEKLRKKIPRIKAVLVGHKENNSYALFLEEYIRKRRLDDSVIITGHLSKRDLRTLYSVCHVATFPVEGQGSWLSPFEALAAGKPIIVSPELTCSALIEDRDIGIVTACLKSALVDVYEHRERFLQKARRGQEFVLENLTWTRFCEQFVKILFRI